MEWNSLVKTLCDSRNFIRYSADTDALDDSPKYLFYFLLCSKEKDTKGNPMVSHSRCNVRGMSVSISESDKHKSVISISGVRMCLNKLSNSTSHKV